VISTGKSGTILIVDDEPLARRTLREHLRTLGCNGPFREAQDGNTAITIANQEHPQLIFLDIVMPGATGLEVLQKLNYEPNVIFTTAHSEYAVAAFELGALDYLLKPFGRERLQRVLQRAQGTTGSSTQYISRAREALDPSRKISKVFVRDGSRIVPISLDDIQRIQGADDYATIVTPLKEYLVSVRLSELEAILVRAHFLRIHRSHLINLDYVKMIEPYDASRVEVVMQSGDRIVASRLGSRKLRELAL
jgi:two-component system LytT family response regulator